MSGHFFDEKLNVFLATVSDGCVEATEDRAHGVFSSISTDIRFQSSPSGLVQVPSLGEVIEQEGDELRREGVIFGLDKLLIHVEQSLPLDARNRQGIIIGCRVTGQGIQKRILEQLALLFGLAHVPRLRDLLPLGHTEGVSHCIGSSHNRDELIQHHHHSFIMI